MLNWCEALLACSAVCFKIATINYWQHLNVREVTSPAAATQYVHVLLLLAPLYMRTYIIYTYYRYPPGPGTNNESRARLYDASHEYAPPYAKTTSNLAHLADRETCH